MKILEIIARICELIGCYALGFVMAIGYGLWRFLKCIFYELPIVAYNIAFGKIHFVDEPKSDQIEIELKEIHL